MAKVTTKGFYSTTINGIKINSNYKCSSSNYNTRASRKISYIVMHYTGNSKDLALSNAKYFQGKNRNASAHFFVDNTSIYQSVALRNIAWHCGGYTYYHSYCRNSNSIGIEMCCTAGNYKVSSTTKENAAQLCAYLCKQLGISASEVDKYVLRHYDITHKKCPAQFVSNSSEWKQFKSRVKELLGEKKTTNTTSTTGYKVQVTANVLNVRAGAGTGYKVVTTVKKGEVYTIVKTSGKWGKLKSGVGWIHLDYTKKI